MRLDADRVLADLRELARRTGGPAGARRVAWTEGWATARAFLRERLEELPVRVDVDEAGNLWAQLPARGGGETPAVALGSHLDAVPAGGWLDGALGVLAGLEVLRAAAAAGGAPVALRLVDFADEEGARFGRSVLGSSAVAGTLDPAAVRDLRDESGERLEDALAAHGVVLADAPRAEHRLAGLAAYVELHIEQGPVLSGAGLSAGAVVGTFGVERHHVIFTGRAAHAGATPMADRRDAFAAAARAALAVREIAIRHGGVATVGGARSEPGIITAVAGRTELLLDQRHLDPAALAAMRDEAASACAEAAAEHGCTAELVPVWSIPPVPFDADLIELARAALRDAGLPDRTLPSGPLHDATEMARRVPTVMVFAASDPPVSHSPEEDSPEADLRVAIDVYGRTVGRVLDRVAAGALPPAA